MASSTHYVPGITLYPEDGVVYPVYHVLRRVMEDGFHVGPPAFVIPQMTQAQAEELHAQLGDLLKASKRSKNMKTRGKSINDLAAEREADQAYERALVRLPQTATVKASLKRTRQRITALGNAIQRLNDAARGVERA